MSTSSLIGVLEDDGRTYRVRSCRWDGYPTHQLPALGKALHKYHNGDLDRLATTILAHDWSFLAPDEATTEIRDPFTRKSWRPDRVQPAAGVGYRYADSNPAPSTGSIDEDADGMIAWLYLLVDGHVRACHAHDGRWAPFGEFSVIDLKNLDLADLTARQAAAYG